MALNLTTKKRTTAKKITFFLKITIINFADQRKMECFFLIFIVLNLNFKKCGLHAAEITSKTSQDSETISEISLYKETIAMNFSTILETTAKVLTSETMVKFNSTANPIITLDSAPKTRTDTFNYTKETTKSTLPIPITGDQGQRENTQNTTISKKKQKQPKTTSIPRSTSPKIKSSRVSHNYTPYDWAETRIIPTTREIDYKESSEFIHESFKKFLLKTRVFVDKSLMIHEFLDHPKQVISITRPRFWGKSLNLNMLRKFFEIEVDHRGIPKPEQDRINRKIFYGGQISTNESKTTTLNGLKIASIASAMDWQGKYPVIQLNCGFMRNGTYEEIHNCMKFEVFRSFKKHFYLESYFKSNPHLLSPSQQSELERYSSGNLTTDDLTHGLRFLSELLHKYFDRKVFILIDDYDTPLIEAFRLEPDYSQNLDRVLQFYREFYTDGFKGNPCLAKGFLTGKLRIANSNLFANLDNIAEYTLLDHQFNQFYGFTEQEVDELLANVSETVSYNIKLFYKGYNYGDQIMYNPWCIKQCIENDYKRGYYWVRSGILIPGNKQKYSLEGLQQHFKTLLGGGSVIIPIKNEVTFQGLEDEKNFFNFILFTGYLSPVAKYPNGTYELMNPNVEGNLFYQVMLGYWIGEHDKKFPRFGITLPTMRNFTSTVFGSTSTMPTNSQKIPLPEANELITHSTITFHLTDSKFTSTSSSTRWFQVNSITTGGLYKFNSSWSLQK